MTLAKLGRFDEARALLALVEAWAAAKPTQGDAPTNLAAQTWDFRLELELLLAEAREMLGLPKPDSLLGYVERALRFEVPMAVARCEPNLPVLLVKTV